MRRMCAERTASGATAVQIVHSSRPRGPSSSLMQWPVRVPAFSRIAWARLAIRVAATRVHVVAANDNWVVGDAARSRCPCHPASGGRPDAPQLEVPTPRRWSTVHHDKRPSTDCLGIRGVRSRSATSNADLRFSAEQPARTPPRPGRCGRLHPVTGVVPVAFPVGIQYPFVKSVAGATCDAMSARRSSPPDHRPITVRRPVPGTSAEAYPVLR